MTDELAEYEFGAVLPVDNFSGFEPGTNVLIVGDSDVDSQALGLRVLARGADRNEGSLVITLGGETSAIIKRYKSYLDSSDLSSLFIIDCSGEEADPEELTTEQYTGVQSPESLTEIGISFVEYDDQRGSTFVGNRVLFDSITDLLERVPEERAFQFIDAFKGRFGSSGYLGIWLLDASEHDQQTLTKFEELFDYVIELRQRDGDHEVRVMGHPDIAAEWRPIEAPEWVYQ